jgi:hypothetical protein
MRERTYALIFIGLIVVIAALGIIVVLSQVE